VACRLLAISLVPTGGLARLLAELRSQHPGAHVTALVGGSCGGTAFQIGADEVLDWQSPRGAAFVRDLRRREFDLVVVAHGDDQYASAAYWKAVALALASRARTKAFREHGAMRQRGLREAVIGGLARGLVQIAEGLYAAAMALLLLFPLVLGVAVTDLSEVLVGGRCGRSRQRPRER